MNSRPVGIAGLGPLFGVRAIADAAGLDGRQVMALMESGAGHSLAPCIAARQIDRVKPPRDRWDEFIHHLRAGAPRGCAEPFH
jgi:hypothetical protein